MRYWRADELRLGWRAQHPSGPPRRKPGRGGRPLCLKLSKGTEPPQEGEGPTTALARFASGLRLSDIPTSTRERVKWLILDSIGCMVAGLDGEEIPQVTALANAIGPTGESSVVGGGTMSIGAASFLNAYLLSASTAMDSFVPAAFHVTPETVPPSPSPRNSTDRGAT